MSNKALDKAYFEKKESSDISEQEKLDYHKNEYDEHEYDYWDELYDEGVRETQMDKIRRSNKRNRVEEK